MDEPSAPIFVINEDEEVMPTMWKNDDPNFKVDTVTLHELSSDEVRSKRTAHDIPCFVLFYIVLGLVSYTVCLGYTYGRPSSLPVIDLTWVDAQVNDFTTQEIAILEHDARYIFGGLLFSIFLAIGWFELLKRVSFIIVYGMMLACLTLILLLGIYLYRAGHRTHNMELVLMAYLCWLAVVIIGIIAYVMKSKLDFTVDVMREAGTLLAKIPEIYGVGLVMLVVYFAFFGIWLSSFIFLFSVPSESILVYDSEDSLAILNYIFNTTYRNFFWILLFGGLWILSVLGFVEQYIVASVVYQKLEIESELRRNTRNILARATLESFTVSFGSIAFGSFLTTCAWFLGMFTKLQFLKDKIPWRNFWLSTFLVDIVTFILEWVSDFAIIYVAITGSSFLQSAKKVVTLLKTEFAQTIVTGLIVSYVLLIGKLASTAFVTIATVWLIDIKHDHVGAISVIVIMASTYSLLHLLSKIYLVACNTILIYTINDISKNKESKTFKSPEGLRNSLLINKINI